MEGKVAVADYDEKKGADYNNATMLTDGQKTEKTGEVK